MPSRSASTTITVTHSDFEAATRSIVVDSGSSPVLHIPLSLAGVTQQVIVKSGTESIDTESSTTQTLVSRVQIAETPGADRTNSLQMITDYVPGAYMVHDQLHVRGGHQVSWLIDGVPVPNTSIASNVGPQFDPKDIDYLEIQRGGYAADYGDRTYGIFNVVPRTGFDFNNDAEIVATFGNYNQTNSQVNFGGHTKRFAYYASVNANRSDDGLETPDQPILHDLGDGVGGFGSLMFNATPNDQLRLVASIRRDFYQVPNTPDQQAACPPDPDPDGAELRDSRRRPRSRLVRQFFLGPHDQYRRGPDGLALLSLQQRRLRRRPERFSDLRRGSAPLELCRPSVGHFADQGTK